MDPPMNTGGAPNAIRLVLAVISAASFVPQLSRIFARRDGTGLSGTYLLLNLLAATNQFSLSLYAIIDDESASLFTHAPPTLGDYLNLAQFTVVLLGHLVLFGAFLLYPNADAGSVRKAVLTAWYLVFLLVSVVPVLYLATLPPPGSGNDPYHDRRWPAAWWSGLTLELILPAMTLLTLVAFIPQARLLRARQDVGVGAVSVVGLAVQSFVFLVVGLVWHTRWIYDLSSGVYRFFTWYQFGGWSVLDNVFFAVVQGALWWVARGAGRGIGLAGDGEEAPLLGHA